MSDSMAFEPERTADHPPEATGTVHVTVSAPDGRPLADVGVEVRAIGMETPWTAAMDLPRTTDLTGHYTWNGLPAGEYAFTVRVPGRRKSQPRRVRLGTG
ncbi:MAG TPA: carboxypeptidase-like regulatory domain-containing protein, partial [Phytomonospora sp.]